MKSVSHLLILILIFPAISFAQEDSASSLHLRKFYADSSYSSITLEHDTADGTEVLKQVTKTQSYHLVEYWEGEGLQRLLIPESNIQTLFSGAEGSQGEISLSAKKSDGGIYNKILWSMTLNANDISYDYDNLTATYYGCCGAENTKELIRYSDGARLLMLSSDLCSVSIPNNHSKRYVGFLSDNCAKGYDDINDSLLCCVVTYVDPASLKMQRAVVSFKDAKLFDSLGTGAMQKITFTPSDSKDKTNYTFPSNLDLWSGEGKSDAVGYTGFTIDLHVFGPEKIVLKIPVVNDMLAVSRIRSRFFNVSLR